MHTDEEKRILGKETLCILRTMFDRWIKSDFDWAVGVINEEGSSGEEDEWDFLRRDWIDKLESWMAPYIIRLYRTGYITKEELETFGEESARAIKTMLSALYLLGGQNNDE